MKCTASILLAPLFLVQNAYAHFVWIEPDCRVDTQKATECDIRTYFGEYSENLKENETGRLLERKGVSIWLDNSNASLSYQQKSDHYLVPSVKTNGASAILAIDEATEVTDMRKYGKGIVRPIYYGRAMIGSAENKLKRQTLDIIPKSLEVVLAVGKEEEFDLVFRNAAHAGTVELTAFAPNGWAKELKPDDSGTLKFVPLWAGRYVIEAILTETTPGEFKGKPYEAVRHRATLSFVAK